MRESALAEQERYQWAFHALSWLGCGLGLYGWMYAPSPSTWECRSPDT